MKNINSIIIFLFFINKSLIGQGTGEIPLTPIQLDNAVKYSIEDSSEIYLPPSIDLSNYMPEVRHQGDLPSCAAWATTYYFRSYFQNIEGSSNKTYEAFSPTYIYRLYTNIINKGVCKGFTTAYLLDSVLINGVIPYNKMPYNTIECNEMPDNNLILEAKRHSIKSYNVKIVQNIFEFKYLLSNNKVPIVSSIKVDVNFRGLNSSTPIQRAFNVEEFTRKNDHHAIVIVGYDDKAFKIINSWGKTWGDNGYGWISYDIFYSVVNYGCLVNIYKTPKIDKSGLEKETSTEGTKIFGNNTYSSWLKEGYYRNYEKENLRIALQELSVKNEFAVVELSGLNSDGNSTNVKELFIRVGETNTFSFGNQNISLKIDKIDNAGRNPFKKAVFYTIKTID